MTKKKLKTDIIWSGANLHILKNQFPDDSVDLIYLDPPFFSGSNYDIVWGNGTEMRAYEDAGMYWQSGTIDEKTLDGEFERMLRLFDPDNKLDDEARLKKRGELRREKQGRISQGDIAGYTHYMAPILRELYRVLKPTGSIYLHCDFHANAHLRILMDDIFGANNFQNEIIWSYRTGGATKKRWSRKHDTILFYTKTRRYVFNPQKEKAYTKSKGRKAGIVDYGAGTAEFFEDDKGVYNLVFARDVWDIPYINSQALERLGYPTQKPEKLLERIIMASSNEGDVVLDPFVGGGTTCVVAQRMKRKYIGIDISPRACAMTVRNFERYGVDIDYTELNFDYPKVVTTMELLASLGKMDHTKYEAWVRNALGFKDKKLSDRIGVDGIKYKERKVAGRRVYDEFLEVKKWKSKVGRSVVSKLAGDMQAHGVRKGIIVANRFSGDATRRAEVLATEGIIIRLTLIDLVIEHNEELMSDPTLIDFYTEEEE
jgi:DNA modification methylase